MNKEQVDFSFLLHLIFITILKGNLVASPGDQGGKVRGGATQAGCFSFYYSNIFGLLLKQN